MKRLLALLTIAPFCLDATQYAPWFPRYLELQPRLLYTYEWYNTLDSGDHRCRYHADNNFYEASLEASYTEWAAEIELLIDSTRAHSLGPDNAKGTVRYLIMDDVVGDLVSWTVGLSLSTVYTQALHDVSVFHHGHFEGELHTAVGKEWTCYDTWQARVWGMGAIGGGDLGGSSPWLHGIAAYEMNHCNRYQGRLFVDALYGLGARDLNPHHFRGYGDIRHQSIDLGLRIDYFFDCSTASVSAQYLVRAHARNCPAKVQAVQLTLLYPFGL